MPSLWQLPCCYSSIKSTATYTKHRASLFLTDRDIDSLLDLLHKALRLLLRHLAFAGLHPAPKSDEGLAKDYAILRIHHL